MKRRIFMQSLGAMAVTAVAGSQAATANSSRTLNVQVRVFRQPRRGIFVFLPGVPVELSNGMRGVTSNQPGMRGTAHFPRLPMQRYTARAFVNGKWYRATASQSRRPQDPPWRVDIQIP